MVFDARTAFDVLLKFPHVKKEELRMQGISMARGWNSCGFYSYIRKKYPEDWTRILKESMDDA